MLLDTKEKDETNKEGFDPNVVNRERNAEVTSGSKGGFWFLFVISWIIIIPGICVLVWKIKKANWFRTTQEKINEAASGIDIQLKKRRDTLIKLVDATQTSIKFEKGLLTDITSLRNVNHFNPSDAKTVSKLDSTSRGILATFENYPNLKTTDTIRDLMQSADYIEREIAASRRLYNATALNFNQEIQAWPSNVIATSQKLHSFSLFAASEEDKKDVSLKMDV
ncbi:MAG: LemA family protein [Mycoplasmataceae bacterium]|nr:LemA family protein [Mycoplasmataceae bacterium]